MKVFNSILVVGLVLLACTPNPNPLDEYAENRVLWESFEFDSYSFSFHPSCFCAFSQEVIVDVRADSIYQVLNPETMEEQLIEVEGEMLPVYSVIPDVFFTIDEFFLEVRNGIENAGSIEITYNREFGYPEEVFIDYITEAVDDEVYFRLSSLTEN